MRSVVFGSAFAALADDVEGLGRAHVHREAVVERVREHQRELDRRRLVQGRFGRVEQLEVRLGRRRGEPRQRSGRASRAAGRELLLNVAAIDRDDVALAGIELDPVVDLRLGERVVAFVAHDALDQHLAGLVEHPQGHADGLAAVAEPAFAGDGVVAVVEAVADRVVGVRERSERRERYGPP